VGHIEESLQGFLEDARHTNPVGEAVYAEIEVQHGREWEDEWHPAVVIADQRAVKVENRKRWVCETIPGQEGWFYKKSKHDTAKNAQKKAAREPYIRAGDVKMWQQVDAVDKTGSAWVDPKNIRGAMSYHLEKRHPFFADPNEEGNFRAHPKIIGIIRFTITCQEKNHTLFYNIVNGNCSSDLYTAAKDTNDKVHIMSPSGERTIYPGHVKAVSVKYGRDDWRRECFKVVDNAWVPTDEEPPASEESDEEPDGGESDDTDESSDESTSQQKEFAKMSVSKSKAEDEAAAEKTPSKRLKNSVRPPTSNDNVSDNFKLEYQHIHLSQNVHLIIICQKRTLPPTSTRKSNRGAAPSSNEKKVSDNFSRSMYYSPRYYQLITIIFCHVSLLLGKATY